MSKILKTNIVFIDTSIFESENFVEGGKINKLFEMSEKNFINIIIPRLTYDEVIERMKKGLRSAKKYMEQEHKTMYQQIRILRNIDYHKTKFPLPQVDVKKDILSLQTKFDEMLQRGKVLIFDETVDHKPIFDKYFASEPPFSKESKKHEFPDAFALATVEQWCNKNDKTCYTLSLDSDIVTYKSQFLIAANDLGVMLDTINRHISEQKRLTNIAKVDTIIKNAGDDLKDELRRELEQELNNSADQIDSTKFELESLNFVDVSNVEINHYSIIYAGDRDAKVEMSISFDFQVNFEGIDYSEAVYDRENNEWYGAEKADRNIFETLRIDIETTILHTNADGSPDEGIIIDHINNGQGIDLNKYL